MVDLVNRLDSVAYKLNPKYKMLLAEQEALSKV